METISSISLIREHSILTGTITTIILTLIFKQPWKGLLNSLSNNLHSFTCHSHVTSFLIK